MPPCTHLSYGIEIATKRAAILSMSVTWWVKFSQKDYSGVWLSWNILLGSRIPRQWGICRRLVWPCYRDIYFDALKLQPPTGKDEWATLTAEFCCTWACGEDRICRDSSPSMPAAPCTARTIGSQPAFTRSVSDFFHVTNITSKNREHFP